MASSESFFLPQTEDPATSPLHSWKKPGELGWEQRATRPPNFKNPLDEFARLMVKKCGWEFFFAQRRYPRIQIRNPLSICPRGGSPGAFSSASTPKFDFTWRKSKIANHAHPHDWLNHPRLRTPLCRSHSVRPIGLHFQQASRKTKHDSTKFYSFCDPCHDLYGATNIVPGR